MARMVKVHGGGNSLLSTEGRASMPSLWKNTIAMQNLATNSHAENEKQETQHLCSGGEEPSPLAPSFFLLQTCFPRRPHSGIWVWGWSYTSCPSAISSWVTHGDQCFPPNVPSWPRQVLHPILPTYLSIHLVLTPCSLSRTTCILSSAPCSGAGTRGKQAPFPWQLCLEEWRRPCLIVGWWWETSCLGSLTHRGKGNQTQFVLLFSSFLWYCHRTKLVQCWAL